MGLAAKDRALQLAMFSLIAALGCTDEVGMTAPGAPADAGAMQGSPDDAAIGLGQPCTRDNECATGTCIQTFPGGYCSIKGCAPATGSGCPSNAVCRGGGGVMTTLCFERCPPSESCRDGYGHVLDGGRRVCCGVTEGGDPGFCAPTAAPACN